MATNDPFAEPDDSERTVIRPNPGGRRGPATPGAPAGVPQYQQPVARQPQADFGYGVPQAAAPAMAPPSVSEAKAAEAPIQLAMTGMNRLNAAAAMLFALVSRIRNRAQHMDPDALRGKVVAEVRAFDSRAIAAGIDPQQVKIARYCICATIDDVVLNTPWGEQSNWALQSMVGTFHRETVGGDRLYDVLARLEKDPPTNIELLEFIYMCLTLGFEGRLRVEQGGLDKHLTIRSGLARIIRAQRGAVEADLSPHWKGVEKPHKARSIWKPVYLAAGVIAVLLTLMFGTLNFMLASNSDRLLGQMVSIDNGAVPALDRPAPPPPAPPPPPPPPPEAGPTQEEVIVEFLKPEIDEGLVRVIQEPNSLVLRVRGQAMFGSGSDKLAKGYDTKIERLARALNDQPGRILIVGHSDNVPIKSSRFPSNTHLSMARAESVMKQMAKFMDDPKRMAAEGRAEKEPIESNDTAEGRAANRRIEIILMKAES